MSNVNTLQMYKAIVSLESEVDQLKQITTINNDNSDLNNYYTKSEIDDKLDDISGANLSNYVQFGENSTDEGIILMGKTQSRFKTTLNQQSLEITDGSVTTNISNSGINCTNKNNDNFTITLDSTNNIAKLEIDGSMNISVGSSTLAITESDVTFKGQSLLGGDDNYIINGENSGNVEIATNNAGSVSVTSGTGGINLSSEGGSVNIASVSSGEINLTSQGSTLAITQDDVTFKGSSLLSGVSGNYVVNGENNNGIDITTDNTNNISLSAEGTGEINLSSKYRINLRANTSRFVVTPDDVTFNDSSFIVNGTNNKNINIKTGDGNSITIEDGNDNIIDFASMHGIKLTSGSSTLNITSDDITFKGQSLIVDTSNFIINGANNKAINISTDTNNINLTSGGSSLIISSSNVNTTSHSINIKASSGGGEAGINLTSGSSTLKIMFNDVTYKGQSLIVDTSNFIINGDNGHNNDVNITGKTINLKASGDAFLAIAYDDITFKGQSLIVDTSNFVINDYENELSFTNGTIGTGSWHSVCYGNEMFVAVSNNGKCAWSTDGKTFTNGTIGSSAWSHACYGNEMFVAISDDKCVWSSDGKTFTEGTISTGNWESVCYGNEMFVAVSNNGKCAWSTDGKTFTNGTIGTGSWHSVCYGNEMFVAISGNGKCAWSTDGKTFTEGTIGTGIGIWYDVCYGHEMFVAISGNSCVWSTDGKTFTNGTIGTGEWRSVCYGNEMFVAVSIDGKCAWSTDGKTFTEGTIGTGMWSDVCYGNGMLVAVGYAKCAWSEFRIVTAKSFALKEEIPEQYFTLEGSNLKSSKPLQFDISDPNTYDFMTIIVTNDTTDVFKFKGDVYGSTGHIILKNETLNNTYFDCYGNTIRCTQLKNLEGTNYALITDIQSSHTITHLCPIASEYSISDFVVGAPVYMSGKVYKHVKDEWVESTASDTIDCISSVCTNGTWKKYLGICVEIVNENEIKFASHGDFMVKYSKCNVGDTLYVTDDGNINVLNDDTPLTLKIQRQIIGLVTEKINDEYCAIFKSN